MKTSSEFRNDLTERHKIYWIYFIKQVLEQSEWKRTSKGIKLSACLKKSFIYVFIIIIIIIFYYNSYYLFLYIINIYYY